MLVVCDIFIRVVVLFEGLVVLKNYVFWWLLIIIYLLGFLWLWIVLIILYIDFLVIMLFICNCMVVLVLMKLGFKLKEILKFVCYFFGILGFVINEIGICMWNMLFLKWKWVFYWGLNIEKKMKVWGCRLSDLLFWGVFGFWWNMKYEVWK